MGFLIGNYKHLSYFTKKMILMRNSIVLLIISLSINCLSGQQLPLDFSDDNHAFNSFSGSSFAFRTSSPSSASNRSGQFFNDGSDPWQGFFIDLNQAIDLSQNQVLTLSFYQFDPNAHDILVKLENGTNPDVEVSRSTVGTGWDNNIEFDFSNAILSGVGTPVNALGTYSKLVIFIDGGINSLGTYLIDDINNGSVATDPHALDVVYDQLVWADEFNTQNGPLDNTKWYHQTFGPNGGRWFNNEEQHYTDRLDNSNVDNGFLNIVAKKESFTQDNVTLQYTSARLNSKFAFTYGRVDVRAKLPEGEGTWPAIWTLGKNINETGAYWQTQGFGTTSWPACGEIDIMEHGLGPINHVSSALHTPSSFGATQNFQSIVLNDVVNDFHVYSVNWSPNQITFLIDDVGFYTYNPETKDANTWPFDDDQFILLNIAMGGVSGNIDPAFTEGSMVIDYVRVYQSSGSLSNNQYQDNPINLFPNPSKDIIYISTNENIDEIQVYSTIGQLVKTKSKRTNKLEVFDLEPGMYLLKIQIKGQCISKKILVE